MCKVNGLDSSVSKCDNYNDLKKAFSIVIKEIREKVGEDSIKVIGNQRNRSYQYIGEDDDPLADLRNAKVINDLRQYWQFCQDSAGFFPTAWLEYFFKGFQDLLDIKSKRQVMSTSMDRMLQNIEYLPILYDAIKEKFVLNIKYKPFDEEERTLVFHPHFLKEYNGRWHLFGHAEGCEPENAYDVALDRMTDKPRKRYDIKYIEPKMSYVTYFDNIVGVSHSPNAVIENVTIRAHSRYMYKLMETKPLHHTQEMSRPFGEYEDGSYGEFSLKVEINNEFIGRILQMGAGLEVVAPANVRKLFFEKVKEMMALYK